MTDPTAQVFRWKYRVVYADCTVGNHVYYSRYLDFLESARGEFFRQIGPTFLQWQERDTIFPVVECQFRYRASARYDDELVIELQVLEAERVRLAFASRILNASGVLLVEGTTRHVCTSLQERPKRLPEELVLALRSFIISAPTTSAKLPT